jgi:hypothetical protein
LDVVGTGVDHGVEHRALGSGLIRVVGGDGIRAASDEECEQRDAGEETIHGCT